MRIVYLMIVFASTAVSQGLFSQQAVSVSGGDATGATGSVSYTVGQTFFKTYNTPLASIHEGVQQPYEIFVISSVENTFSEAIQIEVYPNPVLENLIIEVGELNARSLNFQLISTEGKLLQSGQFSEKTNYLNMGEVPSGLYFLSFFKNDINSEKQIFQIIKIK